MIMYENSDYKHITHKPIATKSVKTVKIIGVYAWLKIENTVMIWFLLYAQTDN